jgi:hypothetical protein
MAEKPKTQPQPIEKKDYGSRPTRDSGHRIQGAWDEKPADVTSRVPDPKEPPESKK